MLAERCAAVVLSEGAAFLEQRNDRGSRAARGTEHNRVRAADLLVAHVMGALRSAVCARWTNETKSMWLPARGLLQTVVLLTPGKWAARWICRLAWVTRRLPHQVDGDRSGHPDGRA